MACGAWRPGGGFARTVGEAARCLQPMRTNNSDGEGCPQPRRAAGGPGAPASIPRNMWLTLRRWRYDPAHAAQGTDLT